jgi:hypothetical protein
VVRALRAGCFGFDVEQLASSLGVKSDEIFEANRTGELIPGVPEDVAPIHGLAAKRYPFRYRDREGALTIEFDDRGGTA